MFAKLGKKLMAFFAVAILGLSLVSCVIEGTTVVTLEEAQENVDSVVGAIIYDATVLSDVTSNLTAVKQNANYPDVHIEWSSSEEDIVSFATNASGVHQMVVNRPKSTDSRVVDGYAAVIVTVKATQTVDEGTATASKTFNLKVKALDAAFFGTVSEITANYLNTLVENEIKKDDANKTQVYSVTYGRVEYIFSKGFYIVDGDAGIYVYGNTEGVKAGDLVKVSGQIYLYWGQLEFGSEVNVEVLSATDKITDLDGNDTGRTQESFEAATYEAKGIKEYTDAIHASYDTYITDIAAYAGYSGATYTLTAELVKEALATGDSYALVDPVNGTKIALYHYCTDDNKELFDSLAGKTVNIQVITVDRYSTNNMFRVLWNGTTITETEAIVLTDAEKVNKAKYEIENTVLKSEYVNGDEFTFPTTGVEGVTVNWAASEYIVDGKIAISADTNIKLTATLTCGEETATVEITLVAKFNEVINTIAEFIAAPADTVMTIKGVIVAKFGSNGKYAYVGDETGTILVYSSLTNKVGDTVKLLATKAYYNGTPQVSATNISETLVSEGEWVIATPSQVTVSEVKVYTSENAPYGAYLQATGKLTKNSSGYYYLTDGTAEISLYNSNVPEDLAAFAGTDAEVTLNFYMYGNSKSDWSGDLRVVFCGREGEYSYEGEAPQPKPEPTEIEATVAEFLEAAESADQWYILTGVVKDTYNTQYGNFYLEDATGKVLVYGLTATKVSSNDKSFATLNVEDGDTLTLIGTRASFNGTAQVGGPAYYVSHTKKVLTDEEKAAKVLDAISVAATATEDFTLAEVEGVVWSVKSGTAATLAGNTVTVVRPAAGQEDATVVFTATYTINEVDYTKDFTVVIPAEVGSEVVAVEYTFDFVTKFSTYASSWDSNYTTRTVTAANVGVNDVNATIVLGRANKQASGQTIDDRPVLAAKSDTTQYVTVTVTAGTIETLTFNLKEWSTSKKFKTIALEYTTDGSTWTAVTGVGQVNASSGFAITNYTVMSTGTLPAGVTGVRLAYLGSSTSNNQIGLTSIVASIKAA